MSGESLQVLVADDAHIVHTIFNDLAKRSPIAFTLHSAYDGRQCMDALMRNRVDLAFIDVNMPEMSGMDAVDNARQFGNKTFVTLMSANANKRRMQLARQLRVYEFLAKPFAEGDVLRILRTYSRITKPVRVLIVDDSATVRRIILKVLDHSIFNIQSVEAGDGVGALTLADQDRFDVVFLDCNMPGLDGPATLERLVARHPEVRVIMISGERNEERLQWTLAHGAAEFLYKPFTPADIDRVLHETFGLAMPMLATVEPLRIARPDPVNEQVSRLDWGTRQDAPPPVLAEH